ncbi:g9787 [Coccomyxa elongata]
MAGSDKMEFIDDAVTDEPILLATGFAGVEVDGALDASVGANEQEHTEDAGRKEVDERTLDIARTVTTEELQKALIPLEISNVAVATPRALAEDGELEKYGAPDNTDSDKTSAEDGLIGVTTKDGPEDLPVKEYLDATVVPVLRDGLRILAKERPEDPHTFLGDYIKAHREAT